MTPNLAELHALLDECRRTYNTGAPAEASFNALVEFIDRERAADISDAEILDLAFIELNNCKGDRYQSCEFEHWYGERSEILYFARALLSRVPVAAQTKE